MMANQKVLGEYLRPGDTVITNKGDKTIEDITPPAADGARSVAFTDGTFAAVKAGDLFTVR